MSVKSRTGEATLRLYPHKSTVGFPAVLARARMIELMELAAARLMKPNLRDTESSVSIEMRVTHVASTTVGGTLRAVATYAGVAGRLHRFRINVFDESGLVGSAEHTRAVITERRVLARARRRADKAAAQSMV
jgi:fluoroacetyl-CoA thioesterase